MIPESYLTPREAATYLRTSVSTLSKLRVRGGNAPPFTRIGRAIRYRRKDLDAYMASQVVGSTSEKLTPQVSGPTIRELDELIRKGKRSAQLLRPTGNSKPPTPALS
jgi:excisionase family DNA binding protein